MAARDGHVPDIDGRRAGHVRDVFVVDHVSGPRAPPACEDDRLGDRAGRRGDGRACTGVRVVLAVRSRARCGFRDSAGVVGLPDDQQDRRRAGGRMRAGCGAGAWRAIASDPRDAQPVVLLGACGVLAIMVSLPAWTGKLYGSEVDVPDYWRTAANAIDDAPLERRVLALPGQVQVELPLEPAATRRCLQLVVSARCDRPG